MRTKVRAQLAIDLNCSADDFDRDGFVFCEAKDHPGRRPFPRGERHFEMLTMGGAVVICATADLLAYIRDQLAGKNRDDAFAMPFVRGVGLYYLPDQLSPLPFPDAASYEWVERCDMAQLYAFEGFHNAISYDIGHPRPDVLALVARRGERIVGMAGASADCDMLWQVGIDVLPEARGCGIAAALINRLTIEILERGKIPYYGTASSNLASQRVAHRAGFAPAWACAYRGAFDAVLTAPTG